MTVPSQDAAASRRDPSTRARAILDEPSPSRAVCGSLDIGILDENEICACVVPFEGV
jgi:hypothetical protein